MSELEAVTGRRFSAVDAASVARSGRESGVLPEWTRIGSPVGAVFVTVNGPGLRFYVD